MIPVNRIKRWPFPGNTVPATSGAADELRVEGEEMLSVFGALTMALGRRDGTRVFTFLKRLATEAAERAGGGVPCIFFKDAMGEFLGVEAEEGDGGDEDGDDGAEPGPSGGSGEAAE